MGLIVIIEDLINSIKYLKNLKVPFNGFNRNYIGPNKFNKFNKIPEELKSINSQD
jgi:hypothetical protein